MASKTRRARIVSVNKLSTTIDKAIENALKRYDFGVEPPNLLNRGELMGRILRQRDVGTAFQFAEDVTAQVNKFKGVDGVPAIIRVPGGIFAGFFDRSRDLRQLGGR